MTFAAVAGFAPDGGVQVIPHAALLPRSPNGYTRVLPLRWELAYPEKAVLHAGTESEKRWKTALHAVRWLLLQTGRGGAGVATPGPSARVRGSRGRRPARTGVPNKQYRGAQQAPSHRKPRVSLKVPANALKVCYSRGVWRPTEHYRGAQQELPGCPARTTGAPDKDYRGAQQKLPGCPTRRLGEIPARKRIFCFPRRHSVLLCLVVVLFNNNREDKGRSGSG